MNTILNNLKLATDSLKIRHRIYSERTADSVKYKNLKCHPNSGNKLLELIQILKVDIFIET